MPILISFTGEDFKFTIVLSTILYAIKSKPQKDKRVFKFSIILNAAKRGFKFTINLYTNPPVKLKTKRDFRLELLSTKGDFKYIALYIEFLAGKLRGYSKEIFKFRIEFCAANISFKDLIFKTG